MVVLERGQATAALSEEAGDHHGAHTGSQLDDLTPSVDRRNCVTCRQRDKPITLAGKQPIGLDDECLGSQLKEGCENCVELTIAAVHERLTKEIGFWTDREIKLKDDAALGKDVRNWAPGELGARTVEILDAAYRSAASGQLEQVKR